MDALEMAVAAEITDIIENGVTADEVIRAKERMVAEAVYARDSLSGGARALGAALASGLSICLLYTSPSPRDGLLSRMPSSA